MDGTLSLHFHHVAHQTLARDQARRDLEGIAILSHLGAVVRPLGALLGSLGAILGPSWAILWPSWSHLGAISGPLRTREAARKTQERVLRIFSRAY